ncbi:MAG TPA: uridine phosphorylase, partial [Candidatus Methanofastidiosa archaeon]|nr:uridine phosphorylase [Candidatus Methanofastidiosa archaeon]
EMECSTLFTISNIFGLRAGSVCAVYANRATDTLEKKGMKNAILASLEAMKSLCEWDGLKKDRGKRYFYPDLLK